MIKKMTKVDENIQTAQNLLSGIVERCHELEEEREEARRRLQEIGLNPIQIISILGCKN